MKHLDFSGNQLGVTERSTDKGQSLRSPSTMDQSEELLSYRKKVEQMTVLIQYYQSQLESQQVRRDGVETVSRLLAECRQENFILKKNQTALEMTVKNLQNRLVHGSGPSANSLTNDYEVIVPGTSKQTLTNLALENKRLRSLLKESDNPETIETLRETAKGPEQIHTLQDTISQLEAENKSMKMKLSDMEALFKTSTSEKDRQLALYQEEIQQRSQNAGETIVKSDQSNRVEGLKEQLKAFMTLCQQFEKQLDDVGVLEPAKEDRSIQLAPVDEKLSKGIDSMDNDDFRQLLEEKQRLQDRAEELTKMNQRWQAYFTERDVHTQSLEQKVKELEERQAETMQQGAIPQINQHVEQVLEESRKEVTRIEEKRRKSEKEAEQLRQEVAARDAQLAQMQSQMAAFSHATQQQSSSEARGIIEHLKMQIQVCTEDFEKERQDRQAALQKIASLQEHNLRLQNLNDHLQTLSWSQANQRAVRPASQQQEYFNQYAMPSQHVVSPSPPVLVYDGPQSPLGNEKQADFPDIDFGALDRYSALDGRGPASLPASTVQLVARGPKVPQHSLSDSALEATKQENILTCPKCNQEFSEERQGELLAHMDVCWE